MITELRIENFAIIDQLELELGTGLVTLTGETGAGKSIILDAIEMLLGGKADVESIRSGAERASVEGTFRVSEPNLAPIHAILEREELSVDNPGFITLRREIRREGRNVARVNGQSVNINLLREIGSLLVDIHGQSEHLSLLNTRQHLRLLDRFADIDQILKPYQENYQRIREVRRELEILHQAEKDANQRTDLLTFQAQEIESANLKPGEEEELTDLRNRLANAESLASLVQESLTVLDESSPDAPSITDLLGQLNHSLSALTRVDPSKSPLLDQAETSLDSLTELARDLRGYQESIEYNPKRLEQTEERLALIHDLKRKYGGSIEAVLDYVSEARRQLDQITHAGERITELEADERILIEKISQQGQALNQKRHVTAAEVSKAIEVELSELHMAGARFEVDFQYAPDPQGVTLPDGQQVAFDATGFDRIEFLIAPNPGEGLKPMAKIASGGETSRLMLSLKNVLAQADPVPTLIFDEIDQGIGGRVGIVVGYKLWRLARRHQVLCVTHLPQLAAFGEQHLKVKKQVENERTSTEVELLNSEMRLRELAQMMGAISEGTLRSANEMLQAVELLKKSETGKLPVTGPLA